MKHRWMAILFCVLVIHFASAQTLTISTDRADGIYAEKEMIRWIVQAQAGLTARFEVLENGLVLAGSGTLSFKDGTAVVETPANSPGSFLFRAKLADSDPKTPWELCGAVVAPAKIEPSLPPPADFATFWQDKLSELNTIPMNATLEPAPSGSDDIEYALIRMDNIRGSHIYGQLAWPRKSGKHPAVLILQWAGIYPLNKGTVVDRAKQGFIALNISAHDAPSNQAEQFYKDLSAKLGNYVEIGQTDRETSYFLRMYLSCYRAADYLASREDWDGRTLVATGASQGGLQSIVAGALHPRITAVIASVPAGCDVTGFAKNRAFGWPYWHGRAKGQDAAKITETSRYFDAMSFAPMVKCPVLVSAGMIDTTCPVSGVLAAVNQIASAKEIHLLPGADHQGKNDSHASFHRRAEAWFKALAAGQRVPPEK